MKLKKKVHKMNLLTAERITSTVLGPTNSTSFSWVGFRADGVDATNLIYVPQ